MPTTSYTDVTMSAASIGARTTAAAAAVDDISVEEIRLLAAVYSEGAVSPDAAFLVQADSPVSMDVTVGSGAAKTDIFAVAGDVAGQGTYLVRLAGATETVTVPAADASQQRIDEIYLVVADAPYDGGAVSLPRLGYRKGDAGGAAPGADAAWDAYALLATITVPAAATTISASDITDGRSYAVLSNGLPAGSIVQTARSTAPSGWLLCDGTAVSRTTYRRLFAAISTTYGVGDGSTTFNVPNLKGRVPVGLDASQTEFDALAETGGTKTHTLTTAEMPSHDHSVQAAFSSPATYTSGSAAINTTGSIGGLAATSLVDVDPSGSGGAHQNLQPYLVVNHIVKV